MFTVKDNAKGILRFVRTPVIVLLVLTFLMSGTVFAFTAGKDEKPLTVFNNGVKQVFTTVLTDADEMISAYKINVAEGHGTELYENADGFYLSVGTPLTLTVTKDGETKSADFLCTSLEVALERMGCLPTVSYTCDLDLSTILTEDTSVNVGYNYVMQQTVSEEIPFETVCTESDELYEGEQKTVTEGANGLVNKTYAVSYLDGNEISRELRSEQTVSEPVTCEILKGTKQKPAAASVERAETAPAAAAAVSTSQSGITSSADVNGRLVSPLNVGSTIQVDENGRPLNYSKCITAVATAYCPEDGNTTAVGEPAQLGYIAVNPRQIPYGSVMFIRASDGSYIYGVAKAADTGGFISDSTVKVDLFFDSRSSAYQFGRRNVEIYFL